MLEQGPNFRRSQRAARAVRQDSYYKTGSPNTQWAAWHRNSEAAKEGHIRA